MIIWLAETKNSPKYLIGYLDGVMTSLVVPILPKMSQFVNQLQIKMEIRIKKINWYIFV